MMALNGSRVPAEMESGVWVVRDGEAFEAGPGEPFRRPVQPAGLTVGSLYRVPQGTESGEAPPAGEAPYPQVNLVYNNPFGLEIERVWSDGRLVYGVELGELDVDPSQVKVAQEYQIVYRVKLDEHNKPVGEPERVPGQYNIYDSVPGMEKYSPLWQFNYVIVPRDYVPNSLRSEADCLNSGYRIIRSAKIEN